jgi:hypothetical protein
MKQAGGRPSLAAIVHGILILLLAAVCFAISSLSIYFALFSDLRRAAMGLLLATIALLAMLAIRHSLFGAER